MRIVGRPKSPIVGLPKGAVSFGRHSIPTWLPSDLGVALRAWYKFDTLAGVDGDPQGAVTDASGNGFHLTQSNVPNQPVLQVAEQNGLNTLRFNPPPRKGYTLPNAILGGQPGGSMYIVYKLVSETADTGLIDWGSSDSSYWPYGDGNHYNNFGSDARKTCGNPTVAQTTYRIFSIHSVSNDWSMYIDGGAGGSAGGTSPFYFTSVNTVGWVAINPILGESNNTFFLLNGWIAEVIFTNARQSVADRQKMEGYLAHKWGLAGELSASHPYKAAAPPPLVV